MAGSSVVGTIAPEAHVASWVTFGRGCIVHPFALVGRLPSQSLALARVGQREFTLTIGDETEIGPHAIIYGGAKIGARCLIGDAAHVREGVTIGNRCVIGVGASINYEAVLADDVRIQHGAHITGGCRIGRGTFIGVNVTTANDKRREIVDYEWVGMTPPVIGERCLIGSGACIAPGVRIGDGAVIGMGALVVKDVPAGATVLGRPATVTERMAQPEPLSWHEFARAYGGDCV